MFTKFIEVLENYRILKNDIVKQLCYYKNSFFKKYFVI